MSKGVNKVILIGRLGKDPEIRYTSNQEAIANFTIATSETWKDKQTGEKKEQTEWHKITAFRKLAEIIGEYVKKGSQIYIEGKLRTRKYTDKNNVERYITEIIADEMQMLDSKSMFSEKEETGNKNIGSFQQAQLSDDFNDDIPF